MKSQQNKHLGSAVVHKHLQTVAQLMNWGHSLAELQQANHYKAVVRSPRPFHLPQQMSHCFLQDEDTHLHDYIIFSGIRLQAKFPSKPK
jgi:hypothetical protein